MKSIFIILDGMGDLPLRELGGKTPLEVAKTPNLDYLASHGQLGYCYTVKENVIPESDTGIISLFGNEPFLSGQRGQLEALGAGLKLQRGDLALRANFATVEDLKSRTIIDRRVKRTLTSKEASILSKAINKQVKLPCKFIFKNTVQHRGALVFRGGFSDNITNTDTAYDRLLSKRKIKNKFLYSKPMDETENAKYSADLVNSFLEQSYKILSQHPINQKRVQLGLLPANIILTRDPGAEELTIKKLDDWCSIAYMPLEIGVSKAMNMDIYSFSYPPLKGIDIYAALRKGFAKAIKFSKRTIWKKLNRYNHFYIQFKETDLPGHDGNVKQRISMIEELDRDFFSFIKQLSEKYSIKLTVTADHSTPCLLKTHTADPVPFLHFNSKKKIEKQQRFTEKDSKNGSLGRLYGRQVLKKFIL